MRFVLCLLAVCALAPAQSPPDGKELKNLARRYLDASGDVELRALEAEIRKVPPLSKKDAESWTRTVGRLLASGGPKLDRRGTAYFYDKKTKRGKYIVSGGGNRKGLVLGLHGGGVGSADCTGAASAWSGAVSSMGMIGIYPQAIEATEAAWGDDVTVAFIIDLLAAACRTFRFDHDRVYVVGHSMGGYGAWTLGGRFADRWAGTVSFAGGPTCVGGPEHPTKVQVGVLANRFNGPMWIYHSDDDRNVPIPATRLAVAGLRELQKEHPGGYVFNYEEVTGRQHAFPAKGPRPALKWITGFTRNPRPKTIVWEVFYERPSQSYWLDAGRPRRAETTTATWDGKATFTISTDAREPETLGVLLEDGMCDLDQPVTVKVNGKEVFQAVPQRSLLTLLRSARRRHDDRMLFCARVP